MAPAFGAPHYRRVDDVGTTAGTTELSGFARAKVIERLYFDMIGPQ